MVFVIGFLIAVAVGLTGIGGDSFTVPCLVLLLGLAPKTAVGTAFIFAGVLRLIVGPFYLWGKQVRGAYVWRLLLGAVPGLLIGTYVLRLLSADLGNPVIIIVLGVLLAAFSSLAPSAQPRCFNCWPPASPACCWDSFSLGAHLFANSSRPLH